MIFRRLFDGWLAGAELKEQALASLEGMEIESDDEEGGGDGGGDDSEDDFQLL